MPDAALNSPLVTRPFLLVGAVAGVLMAAALAFASGALPRPVTSSTTAKHSTSPARNAERMSSRRVARGFIVVQKHIATPAAMISKNTAVP